MYITESVQDIAVSLRQSVKEYDPEYIKVCIITLQIIPHIILKCHENLNILQTT